MMNALVCWKTQVELDLFGLSYHLTVTRLRDIEAQLADERINQQNRGLVSDAFLHWWARFKASTRALKTPELPERKYICPDTNRICEILNAERERTEELYNERSPEREDEFDPVELLCLEQERLVMDSNSSVEPRVLTFDGLLQS